MLAAQPGFEKRQSAKQIGTSQLAQMPEIFTNCQQTHSTDSEISTRPTIVFITTLNPGDLSIPRSE
jgi:plasmid stabilization system protein ParE